MAFKQVIRSKITANDSSAQLEPGTVWEDGATGKVYRYVLVEDAAIANGDVVEYADTSGYEVTKDRSGGSSIGRVPAGVAVATVSDAAYGWIQIKGRHTAIKCPAGSSIAAGDVLVPHASTDGTANVAEAGSTATNTEGQRFGFALGATTATTSAAGTVIGMIDL